MILESLRDLALRENLLADPDYEPKPVAGIISIDDNGKFLGFIPTTSPEGPSKKQRGKMMQIPRRWASRTGTKPPADFGVDNSEFTLGFDPGGERDPEDLLARLGRFRTRIQHAASNTGEPALAALDAFLGSGAERDRAAAVLAEQAYQAKSLLAFEHRGQLVHELESVRKYFSTHRNVAEGGGAQCLICGAMAAPVDKHPVVPVPGPTGGGVPLVNFNEPAFWSFGLERHQNAPVCRGCAEAYTTALKRLLSDRYPDPSNPAIPLTKRLVSLSPDTTAVYWSDRPSEIVNHLSSLLDAPTEEAVRRLLDAPWKGGMPGSLSDHFYCLILSGVKGRAILRGMHTGTVAQLEESLRAYFGSIEIGEWERLPLWRLVSSIALRGERRNLPPGLMAELLEAILFGRRFPRTLLSRAVARCTAEQKVTRERAALVRGYLIRNTEWRISVALDKENKDPGYRLGRLLAVLERTQARAQGNPNKTIVDRYYGAASTRPAVVFPRLIALAQHHLAKLPKGNQNYYQSLLGEVMDGITAPIPATLRLEEQGQFALGYYHQRQFRKPKTEDEQQTKGQGEQQ